MGSGFYGFVWILFDGKENCYFLDFLVRGSLISEFILVGVLCNFWGWWLIELVGWKVFVFKI